MKRMILLVLCALLLAGCSSETVPETTGAAAENHVHTALDRWDRNGEQHWKPCECGEKLDAAQHDLQDDVCTVCGSEVWMMDGMADVYNYNEFGENVRWSSYDGAGEVIADWAYEFSHDAEGNLVGGRTYESGVLMEESEYKVEAGMSVLTRTTNYSEDGSWYINEFDELGNITFMRSCTAEGELVMEASYEFETDADGMSYVAKAMERYADGTGADITYNAYSDCTGRIFYDTEGNVESEEVCQWEYDDEGNCLSNKTYTDGVLTQEVIFAVGEDEFGVWVYAEQIISYFEDGSKSFSVYDLNSELLGVTTYDADGNVVE